MWVFDERLRVQGCVLRILGLGDRAIGLRTALRASSSLVRDVLEVVVSVRPGLTRVYVRVVYRVCALLSQVYSRPRVLCVLVVCAEFARLATSF